MKDKDERNAAAWWAVIALLTAQVAIVVIGVAVAFALERFAGTAEAWRGLAVTIEAIPAWWGLTPGAFVLAVGAAFCAVRWVQAHSRAVEHRALNALQLPPAQPVNGREAVTLAERHAQARRGKPNG